jgi:hypothetical protein
MTNKIIIILLCVVMILATLSGCADDNTAGYPSSVNLAKITCNPIDYTSGVYYFPCVAEEYGNSVASWKRQHLDQVITSVAPNDYSSYGVTLGYFVTTELRSDMCNR